MTSQPTRKRSTEYTNDELTEDQLEQMHVKGKLKKYSRARFGNMHESLDDNHPLNTTNYDEDSDSDSDDDILLTTTTMNNHHNPHDNPHTHHSDIPLLMSMNHQDHEAYMNQNQSHMTADHDFGDLMNLRPSLDQYRTEIAFRLERERNRLETEIKHEKSRNERVKYLDSLQIQKDQILLQFIQEHLDARAYVLRNVQYIAAKIADRL